ncbi:Splicing factor 3b, subunit 2 [Phaffia rhodozyma]|uniref:Splicing factor 3b, subunit 2 n=1 Tax=Phaffia rhodozyma TaxID=264483 RepID=A0A0F7SKF6_PHARH|nr:Splicing factor 3b, subunit 2 [Phaffia rhodozyma]
MPPPSSSTNSEARPQKLSRNQLKRDKKKAKKANASVETPNGHTDHTDAETTDAESTVDAESEVESELSTPATSVEDLTASIDLSDPAFASFASVLQRFQADDQSTPVDGVGGDGIASKGEVIYSDEEDEDEEDQDERAEKEKLSKKKQRKLARLTVADLKSLVSHPEVIEWTDPTARDPRLLVELKSYRNTVPVPGHWSAKRDYLQGKRGVEKAAFQLPSHIADTGIATQRDAIKEKEKEQSLKQKTRERVQPKMGKIDIDYQKLHDAFFRFATKPKMTDFGEIYYEGKELEADLKEKRPGELSEELTEALSIPPLAPPPWLISMQRYGPPPSYPSLRIKGLNAPIPNGAQWGFHPGGWGRPPVDEYNRPIYGDVLGVQGNPAEDQYALPIETELWGELEPEDEEEESDSDDESTTSSTPEIFPDSADAAGTETPSGLQSTISTVPSGMETPEFLDIRKDREDSFSRAGTESVEPQQLYKVIEEKHIGVRGFMGSERGYDLNGSAPTRVLGEEDRGVKRKAGTIELTLDPSELASMSKEELAARYEAHRQASAVSSSRDTEDLSDMVAEEMGRKKSRQAGPRKDRGKTSGRGDEGNFKF